MENTAEVTKQKIFTKDFAVVSTVNLLIMLAYYLLFVVTASFSVEKFSTSPSMSGLVAGLMVLGCLLGRFVTGHFITIIGGKKSCLRASSFTPPAWPCTL